MSLRSPRLRHALLTFSVALAASAYSPRPADPLAPANRALQTGHADDAIRTLRTIVASDQRNGPAQLLLCRAYLSEELFDDAIPACENAVAAMPTSSPVQDWLGRANGLRADRSGPIAGLRLAPKVRDAFEAAVRLNPSSSDAVNDLGEFYIGAPSMIGGGAEKALALADRSAASLPQAAHRLRGLALEKQGDNARAESELRAAVAVSNRPDAWVDLGHFFARRKQKDQCLDALTHAIAADRAADASFVDAAEVLLNEANNLRPDLAEQWLRAYLAGSSQTDASPAFRALTDLARIAKRRGDKSAQQIEANRALALASRYEPAQKLAH